MKIIITTKQIKVLLIAIIAIGFFISSKGEAEAAITFRSTSQDTSGNGSQISISKPSGTQNSDIMVAYLFFNAGGATSVNTPSGWNYVTSYSNTSTEGWKIFVYWAPGSATGTTWSWTGLRNVNGIINAYSGVDTSNPIQTQTFTSTGDCASGCSSGSITTTQPNQVLLMGISGYSNFYTFTTPSGMTVRGNRSVTDGGFYTFDKTQASPGNSGTFSTTGPWSTSGTTVLAALNPAPPTNVQGRAVVQNGSNSTSTITLSKPADVVNGNLMVAFIEYTGAASFTVEPSGWTAVNSSPICNTADCVKMYYKVASSEGANYTWTIGTASRDMAGWITSYTGVDALDVYQTAVPTASPHTWASASTTVTNTIVVLGAGNTCGGFTHTNAPPAGFNEISNYSPGSSYDFAAGYDKIQASTGSTGTPSLTFGSSGCGAALITAAFKSSNTAPTINSGPTIQYSVGGRTRTGANVNWRFQFNASDSEQTSSNALSYELRTGSNGGGTLITSGNFTSGNTVTTSYFPYTQSGISEGSNTVYLRVWDGNAWSSEWFSWVYRDTVNPTAATSISTNPAQVGGDKQYTVTFTANDAASTNTNELINYLYTGPNGTGTYLGISTQSTSGQSKTTSTITDNELVNGSNTRYLRTCDGANNCRDTSFTVTLFDPKPQSVTTNNESGLASYKVTLNGSANPNGSQAYGYFRYFTSAPNCTVDSGGTRVPSSSTQDYNLGSGNSPVSFNITTSPAIPLVRNTNYWYCAYSRNAAAGAGSPGTSAAAGYDTFTTPDGPASACDAPATGNLTISEPCTFPQPDYDGVDAGGSGTSNTAVITLSSGGNITILPGQRVARGGVVMSGGSFAIGNGNGGFIRGGLWLKDSDGDGIIDNPVVKTVNAAQPAGYIRRNYAYTLPQYNTSTFNYASKFYNATSTALDCDSANGNVYQNVANMVVDSDQDGYKTSAAASTQCVGDTQTAGGRTYYRNASGSYTWLSTSQQQGGGATDCQDDPNGAPCPPSSVTASNPSSQTQNNISWSGTDTGGAVPAATGYDIEWCTGSSCTPPASGTLTNVTSTYAHTGRSASTTYGYRVVAKNANGSGTPSSPVRYATTQAACTNGYRDLDGDGVGGDYGCWTGTVVNTQAPVAKLAPATVANDNSIGTVAWSGTVANLAAANDSSVANLTGGGGSAISNYLKITNWGFSIPSGASIVGVIADVRAYHSTCCGYQSSLYSVKLVKGGTVTGSEGKSTSTLPASPAYTAHGAVNSLWGTSLTPADVNSTGFGIAIAFQAAAQFNPGYGSLDHIRLKVFYAGGSPAPSGDYNDSDSSCYVNLGTMYPDNDGDGYTIGSVSNVCIGGASTTGNVGRLSAPSGQSDCYDGNANAKPGQTGYFDQPRGDGHPTLSYDYDCNNGVEIEQASYACCTENSGWITGGVYSGDQSCGGNSSINGACWAADVVSEFTCNSNASYCGKRRVSGAYVYGHSGWVCTSTTGNCSFSGCNTAISLKVENPYYVNCK